MGHGYTKRMKTDSSELHVCIADRIRFYMYLKASRLFGFGGAGLDTTQFLPTNEIPTQKKWQIFFPAQNILHKINGTFRFPTQPT